MTTIPQTTDTHRFGESDYLDASDYVEKGQIEVKCTDYLGRNDVPTQDPKQRKRAGYYNTEIDGRIKPFRLGIKNEKLLAKKFGFKQYEELVGKIVMLQVKKYGSIGYGFVIVGIK